MSERASGKKKITIKRDIPQKKNDSRHSKSAVRDVRRIRSENVGMKMDIRDQTLKKRRMAGVEKRINPDSPEVKRSAKRAQGYVIKKKKKSAGRAVMVYAVIFLFVLIIVSSICTGLFYANLVNVDTPEYSRIKLKMGLKHEEEELKPISVDVSKYYRNGMLYLNMSALANEFGFTITGDHEELRFIVDSNSGDQVRFKLGTYFAQVNGTDIKLDGKVVKEDENVYVPASFITEYMKGIEFAFDQEKSVITVLRDTSRNEAGRFVSSDISFKLKFIKVSHSLSEEELTEQEKAKTYFKNILPDNNDLQA